MVDKNNICKKLRELISNFIFNSESFDISLKEDNEFLFITIHVLSKDMNKILGFKNKIFDSLKKILKASLKNENLELIIDVFDKKI
jgi:predicted RNA-binding protein YlqC (UPF0109 family)